MQSSVKYIYPKIWRIPKDYISKCNLKPELYENKNCKDHILNVICGSHLLHFSPYDSALILDLLTDKLDNNTKVSSLKSSGSIKCKSHTLYKPAIKRIVDSVVNYRTELFPYFYRKFSELHEKTALKSLVSTILDTNSLKSYNLNVLIDLSYLTSYHIPANCFNNSELENTNEEYKLYSRFYSELLENLTNLLSKNRNSLNKVLVYKLFNCYLVTELLKNDSWESQYLIRIYSSLFKLELLDSEKKNLIYRCIELIIYQLSTKDLKLILSISSKLNDKYIYK
ncbi:uncharacterized protein TA17765 [Theileria annulata]|uniref:Uncharacterized protein n=1 Tax=Theileria annulata TaxID=5874 RepID=Q4UB90_THEAN|nr:uncharacterized protein TA17765 [Theileria annulata]CAI75911.1 hypothetical protein TA17765 [Theileria annulata]|eukprot:XP_955387.1 hypothetical protein TA17765 [Theileria annulata]